MTEKDRLYLEHILDCIRRIDDYTRPGREAFFAETLIQDAVVRNLQLVGESVKRVSPTLKAAATGVPWKSIAGFRNVLVHDYLGVDLERVWSVVESDPGDLRESLEAALASPPGGSG